MADVLSARGSTVVGVDAAPRAIEKARAKALERDLPAEFLVADVRRQPGLGAGAGWGAAPFSLD